ncbi:hypothetical protein [Roseibium sp. SCP14]|uniref:hypothetical protein n=1 Tax=Roseibium sp. SCP14 TaxID=3141375 RepID=UPI003338ADBD
MDYLFITPIEFDMTNGPLNDNGAPKLPETQPQIDDSDFVDTVSDGFVFVASDYGGDPEPGPEQRDLTDIQNELILQVQNQNEHMETVNSQVDAMAKLASRITSVS